MFFFYGACLPLIEGGVNTVFFKKEDFVRRSQRGGRWGGLGALSRGGVGSLVLVSPHPEVLGLGGEVSPLPACCSGLGGRCPAPAGRSSAPSRPTVPWSLPPFPHPFNPWGFTPQSPTGQKMDQVSDTTNPPPPAQNVPEGSDAVPVE